jgi:hypothetical protein
MALLFRVGIAVLHLPLPPMLHERLIIMCSSSFAYHVAIFSLRCLERAIGRAILQLSSALIVVAEVTAVVEAYGRVLTAVISAAKTMLKSSLLSVRCAHYTDT